MPTDYALLPPEVNSGLIYTGPGAGPMLVAAAAWDALAAGLESTASDYSSVISGLTGKGWRGPASESMTTAAARYAAWLSATAVQAERTATQAKEAAAAYEAVFAMTVPPPVIAANRAMLMALIATNFFGQNTPAIAATEAHYAEMWAQDAAAMYGYAGASAAAALLSPFSEPPNTTNPAGPDAQAATVAQAVGSATGANTQALAMAPAPSVLGVLNTMAIFPSLIGTTAVATAAAPENLYTNMTNSINFIREIYTAGGTPEAWIYFGSVGPYGALRGGMDLSPTLGLSQAIKVGALSVPPNWAAVAPEIRPAAMTLPANTAGIGPAVAAGMPPGTVFGEAVMGTMSGRGALSGVVDRDHADENDSNVKKGERCATALVAPSRWLASSWAMNTRARGVG